MDLHYGYKKVVYRMTPRKFEKKCDVSLKNCHELKGLINIDDSCYLDSVLFALLAIPNKFINKHILFKKINDQKYYSFLTLLQRYLIYLTEEIRIKKSLQVCTPFRKIIKNYQMKGMPNFSLPGQQEAGEFLIYFLTLFNSQNLATVKHTTYATNSISKKVKHKNLIVTNTHIDTQASIIIFVDSFQLLNKEKMVNHIFHFLKQKDDSGVLDSLNMFKYNNQKYVRKISEIQIIDAPQIIVWCQRVNPITNSILRTKIVPNRKITLGNSKKLKLYAIILHLGNVSNGHYITYFRNKKSWYLYDDISRNVSFIGNYTQLLQLNPNVFSHSVLFFYG